ncbi:hypothetical protein QTP70_002659 [Hemibagrus guttatus]|uniref:Uncharacterized protein n=1 Tax=Hemibagrus guttatus TaxID=175788 RepID=A0AAE0QY08_9TELE|nr:hypothetical protein QTP70_002659 [Hemibagrus guttatus]
MYTVHCIRKANNIVDDPTHPHTHSSPSCHLERATAKCWSTSIRVRVKQDSNPKESLAKVTPQGEFEQGDGQLICKGRFRVFKQSDPKGICLDVGSACGVHVHDRGERDFNDLLSCPHYPLQGLAI